jgi:hypothetical protein
MTEIGDLEYTTYNMLVNNIDIDKEKNVTSKYSFLNLENLVQSFPLDINLDADNIPGYINNPPGPPAFISKSYYQSTPDLGYNYPPIGPIDKGFVCLFCEQRGPEYHGVNCERPFDTSLVLTAEGAQQFLTAAGTPKYKEGDSYKLVVKKRGQRKVTSGSIKSERFTDNITFIYKNENNANTTIRVAKNGSINILSGSFFNDNIAKQLIKKINQTDALNLEEYRKVYPDAKKFEIDPRITYKTLLAAQFNIYPRENIQSFINLGALNTNLWETTVYKKNVKGNNVFMVDTANNYYIINDYRYNSGGTKSKSNKPTNPFIQFVMADPNINYTKINVMIYKRGSVQLKISYSDDVAVDKSKNQLVQAFLVKAYKFLKQLLENVIEAASETNYPIIDTEAEKPPKGIVNMRPHPITGKVYQPQLCQDRKGRLVRPVPYSFYGQCPMPGYYVPPRGNKRADGRYEPCCEQLTETGLDKSGKHLKKPVVSTGKSPDTLARYNNILRNGYPDGLFGETVDDDDSAVFVPGTKIVEKRRHKGLMGLSQNDLIDCIDQAGLIGDPNVFQDRDYTSLKTKVLQEYQGLTGTKSLVIQGVDTLSYLNFNKFTKSAYMITPIQNETINVLLYFNRNGESYFINLNEDVSESGIPPIKELANTIVEGYLYPFKNPEFVFYPVDIIYFKGVDISKKEYYIPGNKNARFDSLMYTIGKIESTDDAELTITAIFDLDIVSFAKQFLDDPNISGLLFIPFDKPYTPKKLNKDTLLWSDTTTKSNIRIALNVKQLPEGNWAVSIDGKSIPDALLPQEKGGLEIPKIFIKKSKISDGDLILFEINFNTDGKINVGKPLIPLEKIDYKINDFSDVINILKSIRTPIKRNVFTVIENSRFPETIGFNYSGKYYMFININEPLNEQN